MLGRTCTLPIEMKIYYIQFGFKLFVISSIDSIVIRVAVVGDMNGKKLI